MSKFFCFLVASVTALAPCGADSVFQWEGGVALGPGVASYDFEDTSSSTNVFSQLDFPLSELGLKATLEWRDGPPEGLPVSTARWDVAVSVLDPIGKFYDQDWFSFDSYPTTPRVLFSYTESSTRALAVSTQVVGTWQLAGNAVWATEVRGGVAARWAHWEARTTNGWYYDYFETIDTPRNTYAVEYTDQTVLTYQVVEVNPLVGVGLRLLPQEGWELSGWADLRLAGAWDDDDHLIRTKRSTALAWGIGGDAGLESRWYQPSGIQGLYGVLGVTGSGSVMTGSQTQTWYGNGDKDVPQGTTYSDVSHVIRSWQVQAVVAFGTRY